MGKGCLPDCHPLNYGAPGMHGSKYANWALNKCDLIIAVGTRFDDRVTGKVSAFAPGAKVIHFDIDAAEVGKIRTAEIPVVGPLKLALTSLDARAEGARAARPRCTGIAQLAGVEGSSTRTSTASAEGVLKPQTVLETLRDLAAERTEDVIWTTGVGQHQMWAMQYLAVRQAAHASSPRAGSARWATACRPRSAPRRRGPTRPSSASTATAASR